MRRSKCSLSGCGQASQQPFCQEHMQLLPPAMQSKLMRAVRRIKAGRGDNAQVEFSNVLQACRVVIIERAKVPTAKLQPGLGV